MSAPPHPSHAEARAEDLAYRSLRADRIIETARRLEARIVERFPESGLGDVAAELLAIANEARERCETIRKSHHPLRIGALVAIAAGFGGLVALFSRVEITEGMRHIENFLEGFEAVLASVVLIGAAFVFLVTLETRYKRRKALEAIGELRAIAHIVDMHQLTKDTSRPSLRARAHRASSSAR